MLYTSLTTKALRLCFEAHAGQLDRAGIPYAHHPLHVAESMTSEDATCVALLHDVLEDTDVTLDDLRADVTKHNNVIERTYKLEARMDAATHDLETMKNDKRIGGTG